MNLLLESCCTNKRNLFTRLGFEVEQASRGLSAIAELLVEATHVDRFPHAYTGEKFPISAQGVFQVPKQPNIWYSRLGCL